MAATVWFEEFLTRLPIKSWTPDVEDGAMRQAVDLANHPCAFKHVALMPDVHQGYGMPIGGVVAFENAISPNCVGMDIGCGMGAVQTDILASKVTKAQLRTIREKIEHTIPTGAGNTHKKQQEWGVNYFDTLPRWINTVNEVAHIKKSIGTLGGGNHFIELQEGSDGFLWIMLHSGSRKVGHSICTYYNKIAKEENARWHSNIPSKDLAFFPTDSNNGQWYIDDMAFALDYAMENRRRMMNVIKDIVLMEIPGSVAHEINIHHNYASLEHHFDKNVWVHRKGATSARKGQLGIIPGSMGTPSYIVEGLGNPESFMSCSHGAGRKMSRTEACKKLDIDKCNEDMRGIEFKGFKKSKQKGLWNIDEAPDAYKNIKIVIDQQVDLVKAITKLYPLAVVKG